VTDRVADRQGEGEPDFEGHRWIERQADRQADRQSD
jgi:hypothetical protein